jgi:hypothetical protein
MQILRHTPTTFLTTEFRKNRRMINEDLITENNSEFNVCITNWETNNTNQV